MAGLCLAPYVPPEPFANASVLAERCAACLQCSSYCPRCGTDSRPPPSILRRIVLNFNHGWRFLYQPNSSDAGPGTCAYDTPLDGQI